MPNTTVLPPLLDELDRAGVGPDQVDLLCATGTHRSATQDELVDSGRAGASSSGTGSTSTGPTPSTTTSRWAPSTGSPILLDRRYVDADRRILTGFVEPHFFAGWSGGPKGTCPGLAATSTILEAHSPDRIADPDATWLTLEGNPVHEFVRAATDLCPPDLCVDVTIDDRPAADRGVRRPASPCSHRAAVAAASRTVTQTVPGRFDVVRHHQRWPPARSQPLPVGQGTGRGGAGGEPRAGSSCWWRPASTGCPTTGPSPASSTRPASVEELARPAGPGKVDGWQAQVLGRVLRRAEVWMYSDGPRRDGRCVRPGWCRWTTRQPRWRRPWTCRSRALGRPARLCVLPQGPLTVATPIGASIRDGGGTDHPWAAPGAGHPCPAPRPGDRVTAQWPTRWRSTLPYPTNSCRRSWPRAATPRPWPTWPPCPGRARASPRRWWASSSSTATRRWSC